jgi:hypothetical protein
MSFDLLYSLDDVTIYMLALRLQSHPIDVLITLNHVQVRKDSVSDDLICFEDGNSAISQISSIVQENPSALYHANSLAAGAPLSDPEKIFHLAINSFEIRDYNLFGSQEE